MTHQFRRNGIEQSFPKRNLNESIGRRRGQICAARLSSGLAMGCELDALLEDVEGDVSLLLVDDERGAETDAGLAATEDEEAALEGELDDLVAHGSGGGAGFLIFNDLEADHQAAAADFTNGEVFCDPRTQALEHLFADSRCVFNALTLDDVHRGERGGD